MNPQGSVITRRQFVAVSALGGAIVATGCDVLHRDWDFFTNREAATLTAICDQIIPADEFPSASQAGVLTYIDHQLARVYRRHRDTYRNGIQQADQLCHDRFGVDLASASGRQQLEIATALESQNHRFFSLLVNHTMQGYYGSPRHGGNLNAVSWHMLGLDEPPLRGRAQYDLTAGAKP